MVTKVKPRHVAETRDLVSCFCCPSTSKASAHKPVPKAAVKPIRVGKDLSNVMANAVFYGLTTVRTIRSRPAYGTDVSVIRAAYLQLRQRGGHIGEHAVGELLSKRTAPRI